ncbi:unnamed protein product [Trichobilharzia szidati]|nr:unnamed protein product [Trichobilharzia szidati]
MKINKMEVQSQYENLYDQISDLTPSSKDNLDWFKVKLVDISHQFLNARIHQKNGLSKEHHAALKELIEKDNLIILKPDKGEGVVIMNKSDYQNKMNDILKDQSKFLVDNATDNVLLVEKQINRQLQILLMHGFIDEKLYKQLKAIGSHTPQLYGLPKIHKTGNPLRPILDMSSSPYHKIAKWITEVLTPVRDSLSNHSLKSSFDLTDTLDTLNIKDKVMCSIDIESLFTNVPLNETVDFICDYITSSGINLPIPVTYIRDIILMCTENIRFTFQEKAYKQIDGVAMGSPLGPLLADMFMSKLEKQMQGMLGEFILYKRYVDDTLIIGDNIKSIENFITLFNHIHPNIRVTSERESNNKLGFLDITMTRRDDGTIQRSIFRKQTWSGQYLHFTSFVPIQYKRSLVKCLFSRARKICTSDTVMDEFRHIHSVLLANGYPENFITCHSKERPHLEKTASVPKKAIFINLPFKGDQIMQLTAQRLRSAIKRTFYAASLFLTCRTFSIPVPTIKGRNSVDSTSNCIYKFTCSCGDTYIGRTNRMFQCRRKEHVPKWLLNHIENPNASNLNRNPASSIAKHLLMSGHKININDCFTIISHNSNSRLLKVMEALWINHIQPKLCVQKSIDFNLRLPWTT